MILGLPSRQTRSQCVLSTLVASVNQRGGQHRSPNSPTCWMSSGSRVIGVVRVGLSGHPLPAAAWLAARPAGPVRRQHFKPPARPSKSARSSSKRTRGGLVRPLRDQAGKAREEALAVASSHPQALPGNALPARLQPRVPPARSRLSAGECVERVDRWIALLTGIRLGFIIRSSPASLQPFPAP